MIFNELIVAYSLMHLFMFSDAVKDQATQYFYGWSLVILMTILCFVDAIIIIGVSVKMFILAVRRTINKIKRKFTKSNKVEA